MKAVEVKGAITTAGALTAHASKLASISVAQGSQVKLFDSTATSITVSKGTSIPKPIELSGSTVSENIVFEHEDGQVILRNGAEVKGKVIGGTIVNK